MGQGSKEKPSDLDLLVEKIEDKIKRPKAKHVWDKGESPVVKWRKALSPEDKKKFYEGIQKKSAEARAKKKQERAEATEKAKEMLPEIIAQQMLLEDNPEYKPSSDMIGKLRTLMDKGYTVEQMRQGAFRQLSDKSWQKLLKFLFKDHIAQVEDVGLELITKKKQMVSMLKKRVRIIKKELRAYKAEKKFVPPALLKVLGETEDKLMEIELDMANTLHKIGAVGEKSKAASINIYTSTPRPRKPEDEAIDVTPKVQTLDGLIKKT